MAFTLFLSVLKADLISGAVAAILGHEVLSMRMKVSILMMVEWKDTKSMWSLMAQLSSWSNARNYLHSDFLILEKIKPFCLNHQSNAILMPFILISVFQFSLEESPFFHSRFMPLELPHLCFNGRPMNQTCPHRHHISWHTTQTRPVKINLRILVETIRKKGLALADIT